MSFSFLVNIYLKGKLNAMLQMPYLFYTLGVGLQTGDWQTTLLDGRNKSPPCGRGIHTACACHQQPMDLGREPPSGLGTSTDLCFLQGQVAMTEQHSDIHAL